VGYVVRAGPLRQGRKKVFDTNRYIVLQKIFSNNNIYIIKNYDTNKEIMKAKSSIFSWGEKYKFVTPDGEKWGSIRKKVLSVRATFQYFNPNGDLVLSLKKKIFKMRGTEYWFEDYKGNEVARVHGNIWAHNYKLLDKRQQNIAQISKKWISIRNSYSVEILGLMHPMAILGAVICIDLAQRSRRRKQSEAST